MLKEVYKSELENDKFYLNKNNSLLTDVELFDNYFVTFNIEQHTKLFVKFLNEFNVSI